MPVILEAVNLSKRFTGATRASRVTRTAASTDAVLAVDDISFSIEAGSCFGLLGPNGAGKTTTVEMLEGIVAPTTGMVRYRQQPLDSEFHQRCGIMFQNTALQDYLTVRESLRMFSSLYHHTLPEEYLVSVCGLEDFLLRDTRKLSGGQRQRLLLAIALVNDPDVVFLDEPTTGLDPHARRRFWDLVQEIKAQGKTIILTTHYMDEAMQLCDRLIFMNSGRIIADGVPSELLASHFDTTVLSLPLDEAQQARLDLPGNTTSSGQQHVSPDTDAETWQQVSCQAGRLTITTTDVDQSIIWLQSQRLSLTGLDVRARTLDDLFLALNYRSPGDLASSTSVST